MGRWLHALGRSCARHGWSVVTVWVLLIVLVFGAVNVFGSETSNDLSLPGTGSQQVKDLLEERFPPQQNGANPIVFNVETGQLTDQQAKASVKASINGLRDAPHVYSVTNPLSSAGRSAGLLSKDQQTAFAPVLLDIGSGDLDTETAQTVFDATQPAQTAGIDVAAAGSIGSELSDQPTESSELVGILAAMFILTLVLGSLVAMGLPILAAVVGLGVALGGIGLLGHIVSMPDTGATLATMIGLGVGIDYALFLISRHQDQLKTGMPVKESIAQAVATSGGAIVFAGGTVVAALLSLRVAGIPLLSTLGLASALAVVTAVLAAITLLPAVLGLLGSRVGAFGLPSFLKPGKKGGAARGSGAGFWAGWSGFVARHPLPVTVGSLAVIGALIIPAPSLQFGQEDIGAASPQTTERQAYDLISAGFGVGYNGPLQVASELTPVASPSDEYTSKYDKAVGLKRDLEQKSRQLPKEKEQLEAQQRRLEKQQDQLVAQERQLEAQRRQLVAAKQELEDEQATLERQAAALPNQVNQLQAAKSRLVDQRRQLEAEKARLTRQKNQLEAKQARLEQRRDELRAQILALANQIRPLVRELVRILARERILWDRIDNLDDRPVLQELLLQRLRTVVAREHEVRAELAPLRREAEQLAREAARLAAQAAQLLAQEQHLEAEAAQLASEAAQLVAQAQQLQARAAELRARAAALTRQKAALLRQADALEQQGEQLQQLADSLQQQGVQLQQAAALLQQQAIQLKAEKRQAQQEEKQATRLQQQLTDILTAAGGDPRNTDPRVVRLQTGLSDEAGVVALTPPQTNKKGDVVLLSAIPEDGPATDQTAQLLTDVRDDVVPQVDGKGGMSTYVGGYTASYVDLATLIAKHLLLVIGTVILLGFLLLMIAFRSILIPLQAAVTNLLSAAAAFGILTATFQWGWGISLVGLDTASDSVPIASYVPLMMFAVLFGLSMDYEVFLVSHVQQHHLGGEPARKALISGLKSSGRITTAACLIMTSVFASFVLNGDPTIKQFGVGLASAVLLAGILVVTLAPATITLMGEAAWWLPKWLDRILPHVDIEGGGGRT